MKVLLLNLASETKNSCNIITSRKDGCKAANILMSGVVFKGSARPGLIFEEFGMEGVNYVQLFNFLKLKFQPVAELFKNKC